jgi:hypothetical protein
MIHDTPGGGDNDMGSVSELERLGHHIHAPDNDGCPHVQHSTQHSKLL